MKRILCTVVLAVSASLGTGISTTHAAPVSSGKGNATFEGRQIDLSKGWGAAKACLVTNAGVDCFSSEAAMDAAIDSADAVQASLATDIATASVAVQPLALGTCGTSLRLYDGTSFTGTLVAVSSAGTYINLANFGFDNKTSSFKIGACYTDLFSGASGGGSIYPGNTSAGASAATMIAGWANTISSVYQY